LDRPSRVGEAFGAGSFAVLGAEVREILGQDHELCAFAPRSGYEPSTFVEVLPDVVLALECTAATRSVSVSIAEAVF
jgi:hypothetical protein